MDEPTNAQDSSSPAGAHVGKPVRVATPVPEEIIAEFAKMHEKVHKKVTRYSMLFPTTFVLKPKGNLWPVEYRLNFEMLEHGSPEGGWDAVYEPPLEQLREKIAAAKKTGELKGGVRIGRDYSEMYTSAHLIITGEYPEDVMKVACDMYLLPRMKALGIEGEMIKHQELFAAANARQSGDAAETDGAGEAPQLPFDYPPQGSGGGRPR